VVSPFFPKANISDPQLGECTGETTDEPSTSREAPYTMSDDHHGYRPKDVADPHSPGWRNRCNANGVSIAGTYIGLQRCQWSNCATAQILAVVKCKQTRGLDHHALIKETVDLWRSVCDGNEETATWFRQKIEIMADSFNATEDTNILTLMQSTVRNCLLRLFMVAGTTMADAEHNDAIKAHVRRTASDGNDPDEDVWSTRSIY
jgi:hypothetical protein